MKKNLVFLIIATIFITGCLDDAKQVSRTLWIADSTKAIQMNSTLTLYGLKINTVEDLVTVSFLKLGAGNTFETIRRGIKWEVEGRAGENTYIVRASYNGVVARMETEVRYDYISLSPLTIRIETRNGRSTIFDLWMQEMIMQSIQGL